MFDLINDLKALKELVVARNWWEAGDAAWSLAKKVKDLIADLSDSGLFKGGNEAELEKAEQELLDSLPVFKFGAVTVDKDDPKAIDPVTVITLVTLVLELIKKWRDNRKK